jgi:hypothetical protein
MDYAWLRSTGIEWLERLAGQAWTDFNAHDPGITILEQLCYALTDLAYRTGYDLKDLLAGDEAPYRSLYSPAQILPTNPVTLLDLRKWLIDVDGVKNAWVEALDVNDPALLYDPSEQALYLDNGQAQPAHRTRIATRGLYRVLLETDDSLGLTPANILPEVNRRLHACRLLGEDFLPPTVLPGERISIAADIEIERVEDPEQLLAAIYQALSLAISPRIRFYTLDEMLAKGYPVDAIFDGPLLQHGFVLDDELAQFQRKPGLRSSDLLQVLMAVPGVTLVNQLSMANDAMRERNQAEAWYLPLTADSAPFLNISLNLNPDQGNAGQIRLLRNGIVLPLDSARVAQLIAEQQRAACPALASGEVADLRLPPGRERQIGRYYSIQHQFPALYGIGSDGLPDSSTQERQAQSRQLKAYLMFFDQILANQFAQLAHAKDLFSFFTPEPQSYFCQSLADDELDLTQLYTDSDPASQLAGISNQAASDSSPGARKNRFLNHLLARFGEQLTDYALLQYGYLDENDLIRDKSAFLQLYPQIGQQRASGFDYTRELSQTQGNLSNRAGLEMRIRRLLGLSDDCSEHLAGQDASSPGGFHLLEHILLRPRNADVNSTRPNNGLNWQTAFLAQPVKPDPYSHQLSFIFPDWIDRFSRPEFRQLIENTVREATPAHLHLTLYWLNPAEMAEFETVHALWLGQTIGTSWWNPLNLAEDDQTGWLNQVQLRDARDRLLKLLRLGQPWPLRDLQLDYPPIVAYNTPATIKILGAQCDVTYQLCDEDGNPLAGSAPVPASLPSQWQAAGQLLLKTPAISKDITFTILAARESGTALGLLETWLLPAVEIQAGIDTTLLARFAAQSGQVAQGADLISNYDDKITVTVELSQEGISYKLVANGVDVSNPVKGNKGSINLLSSQSFREDTTLTIRAYRTANYRESAMLDVSLLLWVRPNPALALQSDQTILNYRSAANLTIAAAQDSVEYRLYRRTLGRTDYRADGSSGALLISNGEGRQIAVQPPVPVTDWANPNGFALVGVFANSAGTARISSGNLAEDTLLIVQAIKLSRRDETQLQLQLAQSVALLVRPNPGVAVGVAAASVASGSEGMVILSGTQNGVSYQLRGEGDNHLINPPGYHVANRAVETMRLEVDWVVEGQIDNRLLLPTGALTQAGSFNILAQKTQTGVSAPLTAKATIGISNPP